MPELDDVRNQRVISDSTAAIEESVLDENGNPVIGTGVEPMEHLAGVVHDRSYANGAGNPYLQPEISTDFDMAVEWCFAEFGSLTATVFDKKGATAISARALRLK